MAQFLPKALKESAESGLMSAGRASQKKEFLVKCEPCVAPQSKLPKTGVSPLSRGQRSGDRQCSARTRMGAVLCGRACLCLLNTFQAPSWIGFLELFSFLPKALGGLCLRTFYEALFCISRFQVLNQAKEKSTNSNFWVRISCDGSGVFHLKRWGQKVRYVLRNPGKTNFLAGYPRILGGGARKGLEKSSSSRLGSY